MKVELLIENPNLEPDGSPSYEKRFVLAIKTNEKVLVAIPAYDFDANDCVELVTNLVEAVQESAERDSLWEQCHEFVKEQAQGEWSDNQIKNDADKLKQFVLSLKGSN